MSEKDKQHTGEVYFPGDPEILEEQIQYQEKLYDYNQTRPSEQKIAILNRRFTPILVVITAILEKMSMPITI